MSSLCKTWSFVIICCFMFIEYMIHIEDGTITDLFTGFFWVIKRNKATHGKSVKYSFK